MHWILIIIGTFILSLSVSNPFYKMLIAKRINIKTYFTIIFRLVLFFVGIILIFLGLYLESL